MEKKRILSEFFSFIRIENGLFTGGVAVSGYLIFNQLDFIILSLFFAMFLGTGASYAYNYLKDKREDIVNKKILNYFVIKERKGRYLVMFFYASGLILSFLLSFVSLITYIVLVALSLIYSGRPRIKERFLLKNIYTGFAISLSFVIGATAEGYIPNVILSYVFIVFILGFAANVLGDIRGYAGDKSIGMVTLPILLGFEKTKIIIYSIILFLLIMVLLLENSAFYPIMPFMIAAVIFLFRNRMRSSRMSMLSSFAFLPVFLIFIRIFGGV